ncbi:recombinase RecA [Candidatus Gracilibacteria bacterium]|jgi:recombination protein RecA|nr:recombinase RecA [Candidatus Gracilibacteria bacterium]
MTKAKDTNKELESLKLKKLEAVKMAMSQIRKNFGDGAIMKLGERQNVAIATIPTGSLSLDIAVGGGIPKGRITEIYGPESSGKTTLTLHIIAECQRQGGTAAFVDAEHALDPEYARKIGVNIDELLISQPDNGEQALEIVDTLVRSNSVDLIIVDSVAALTPRAEIEGDMGDSHMGLQARLMSQALRKITASVSKSNAAVIFINQLRMKIGVMFGNPETTTGGNALKFYSSLRLEIRSSGRIEQTIDGNKERIGNRVTVKVVKNKIAPPFKVAEFDIIFNEGISYEGDLLDLAAKHSVVRKAGAFYSYNEQVIGQGRDNARQFLKNNKEITNAISEEVKKAGAQLASVAVSADLPDMEDAGEVAEEF